jgi:nucleotide-binding universal stress UspA family protein
MAVTGARIVVGWDGSDRSRDALALARLLRKPGGATLVVACVYPYEPLATSVGARDPAEPGREDALAKLADAEVADYEHRILPSSSAAHGLQNVARDEGAELIVVGSTHRGRLGRVVPGSVGERLLHGAPCAVAVAPLGYGREPPGALGRIGVAVDGSPASQAALASAVGLARAREAELRVLTVVEWINPAAQTFIRTSYEEAIDQLRAARQGALERALTGVPAEVRVVGRLLEGDDPVRALCRAAEELDLLVLGSRGYGPIRHVFLGGVSGGVLSGAPCPVLVTPRGVERPFGAPEPPAEPRGEPAPTP